MSQSSDAFADHINSGHYERPEPRHLNLTSMEALKLQEAIEYIQQHGLRVVPNDWKVQ